MLCLFCAGEYKDVGDVVDAGRQRGKRKLDAKEKDEEEETTSPFNSKQVTNSYTYRFGPL